MTKSIFLLGICLFFSSASQITGQSQSSSEQSTSNKIEVFQEEEIAYIENWIANLIAEARLDSETISRFKIVTSFYALKMEQIEEERGLTKIEIIERFNILVKRQNKELEQILPKEQFNSFSKFYEKLAWSVNKRLNQL